MRSVIARLMMGFVVLWSACVFGADGVELVSPPTPFAVVLIDRATERALGEFPYDRAVYARGIEALGRARVRGVVLKFFIDRAKTAEGDAALAEAMRKMKLVLQARLDAAEARPNALPERFF